MLNVFDQEDISTIFVIPQQPRTRLARYVKLRVAHTPEMPGTFSLPPRVSDPDIDHGTCVTHVSWCMSGTLTCCFLWSQWWGKYSRHSWRMRNPQFYLSDKRPITWVNVDQDHRCHMASLCHSELKPNPTMPNVSTKHYHTLEGLDKTFVIGISVKLFTPNRWDIHSISIYGVKKILCDVM